MTNSKTLPKREEVPEALTWDLERIYPDSAAFEADFQKVSELAKKAQQFKGQVAKDGQTLYQALVAGFATFRLLEKVYVYASMKSDQDTGNNTNQALVARASTLANQVSTQLAFIEPEIIPLTSRKLEQFYQAEPRLQDYAYYLTKLQRQKKHVLNADEEALVSGANDVFAASRSTFNVLDNADLEFPLVLDEDDAPVQLSSGLYSTLIESKQRKVRKGAFMGLFRTYGQFQNTFAQTLTGEIKSHNYLAKVHHYPNARAAALAQNQIPEIVYDTLIQEVNNHLDLLHRYVALRKKVLDLDELHMYDLYAPLTPEPVAAISYQSAQNIAKKALAILGPDYLKHVEQIFSQRTIDVCENKGKRSGAYSGGAYDTDPYELLNWHDNLNNVYTLVHETGHSVHSWYTRHHQPYQYGDYPIFLAEIASTTNENLLTEYLLKTQTKPQVRAYLLNYYLDSFKGTLFRQTQFAEFEHFLHTSLAAGQPLTANKLNQKYGDLNARYYGPAVISDPEISLEWARIPHFYMNYYVYQYATGFAAATTLSENMMSQKPQAVNHYLDYLQAGSSADPIDIMKHAGVDMTKPDYLRRAFDVFAKRLNELEKLLV